MRRYSRISGTGSYLPPRRLTNADMVGLLAERGFQVERVVFGRLQGQGGSGGQQHGQGG